MFARLSKLASFLRVAAVRRLSAAVLRAKTWTLNRPVPDAASSLQHVLDRCLPPTAAYDGFVAVPTGVFASVIAPLLATADLLAFASTSHAMRRLVVSPAVWRHRVFTSFPALPSTSSLSSPSSLPSWCSVVQIVDTRRGPRVSSVTGRPLSISALRSFSNLRHVYGLYTAQHEHVPDLTSLASLRHLTRVSLYMAGCLEVWKLRLLVALPVLASFAAQYTSFEAGSAETLREWQAVRAGKPGAKRAVCDAAEEDQHDEQKEGAGSERVDREEDGRSSEGAYDLSLAQRHSPLLLFLHALAAKPTLVHLRLHSCGLTPFVLDHTPVWPYLLCLALCEPLDVPTNYSFARAIACFPSLTSLTTPDCSDAALEHIVQLPRLEELRVSDYTTKRGQGQAPTTTRGFLTLSTAVMLRSVHYSSVEGADEEPPSLASLIPLFTLAQLTRLSLPAWWMTESKCVQLFTQHRFEHLRCLELFRQSSVRSYLFPQTNAALLSLVKPTDVVVPGRADRQAARAARRVRDEEEAESSMEGAVEQHIPTGSSHNFPALECLVLAHRQYGPNVSYIGRRADLAGEWIRRQLRRSYEYEVVAEWEAEMSTLGEAELLRNV